MGSNETLEMPPRRTRPGRRYWHITLATVFAIVALAMLLPLGSYLYTGLADASAQAVTDSNPRANFWDAVRRGAPGYTAVQGQETGVLIQNGGQNWRQIRNGLLTSYGAWYLFAMVVLIVLFYLLFGSSKLQGGESGKRVKRWGIIDRWVHWLTASLFVILAVTGLSLLFGRAVLIPLLGPKGFAAWAGLAVQIHNYAGPVFSVGVFLMVVLWVRHNLPARGDLNWFLKGGGMVGKSHPDAGFANAGEKVWFWFIVFGGGLVIASGYVLDFPNWGTTREDMQLANLVHGAVALVWIGIWMGHAYIGTIGTEGALEGMTTGYVDEKWAEQHHNLWYEKVSGADGRADAAGKPAPGVPAAQGAGDD